jgi:hypothetical protein
MPLIAAWASGNAFAISFKLTLISVRESGLWLRCNRVPNTCHPYGDMRKKIMFRTRKHYWRNTFAAIVFVIGMTVSVTPLQAMQATQRPLSDFISTQGTTNIFVPPVPDFIGWLTAVGIEPPYFASVDYAGLANGWLMANGHPSLGTTFGGSVTERPLPDGRAQVSVNLHTRNALTWVGDLSTGDFATGTLLFGNRAQDVLAGAEPALGESHFQAVFRIAAPGAPIPDRVANGFCVGPNPAGCELISLSFRANASGVLHAAFGVAEGTPGRAVVSQTGVLFRGPFKGATADGFPVELIQMHVTGQ